MYTLTRPLRSAVMLRPLGKQPLQPQRSAQVGTSQQLALTTPMRGRRLLSSLGTPLK